MACAQPALGPCPENAGSRFLSLLQNPPDQTFSAIFGTTQSPTAAAFCAPGLGVRDRSAGLQTASDNTGGKCWYVLDVKLCD